MRGVPTWPLEVRLDMVVSRENALKMIATRAKSLQPGEWILTVGGWHPQQFLDDPRPFTKQELDQAAPNNPVFIQLGFASGVANSLALNTAGAESNPAPRDFQLLTPRCLRCGLEAHRHLRLRGNHRR